MATTMNNNVVISINIVYVKLNIEKKGKVYVRES